MRFIGRFDFSSPEGPRFAWAASAIAARFHGTGAKIRLRQFYGGVDDSGHAHKNRFLAFVDKRPPIQFETPEGTASHELASDLPAGVHELLVYKITEALVGEVQYLGLELSPGGRLLAPPPPAARNIEIVGASTAAGYGNEGADEKCTFSAATQNEYLSFGAFAARDLGAEHTNIAYSGKGVLMNFDLSTEETLPALYGRILPGQPRSVWEPPHGAAPDAVVVSVGAIDMNQGTARREAFVGALRDLLRTIRRGAPAAHLFATIGPLLTDDWPPGRRSLSTSRAWVGEAVESMRSAGDRAVHFLEFPTQEGPRGCASHPTVRVHRRMADQLVAALKKELGW